MEINIIAITYGRDNMVLIIAIFFIAFYIKFQELTGR